MSSYQHSRSEFVWARVLSRRSTPSRIATPFPVVYRLRSVLLDGIAEWEPSVIAADFLESGDFNSFGKLMSISHDGDRIVGWTEGEKSAYDSDRMRKNRQLNSSPPGIGSMEIWVHRIYLILLSWINDRRYHIIPDD